MPIPPTERITPSQFDFDRARLDRTYAVDRLQQEVRQVIQNYPPYIYYSTIPLIGPGKAKPGVTDFSDPDWTTWVELPILKSCPYIQTVLASLDCRKTSVRLLRLEPGGVVQEHTDPTLNLDFRQQVRLHVPVFTNAAVKFRVNGAIVPFQPGELWYLRFSDAHSVHNDGATERIHLSIDVVVNDWLEQLIVQGRQS
ncbi:MAG: aspartyl/asparaginyl beta-hydroxylase domain-containing protein [Spirulinaceae cyanobacterium]